VPPPGGSGESLYSLQSRDFAKPNLLEWLVEVREKEMRVESAPYRQARAERLAQYEAAVALSSGDLLTNHEPSDPWLCVPLLDEKLRPMAQQICALSPDEREQLLDLGRLVIPIAGLDETFRHHLARWVGGEWGRPGSFLGAGTGVDTMTDLPSPEARWDSSSVWLWCRGTGSVELELRVPDVGYYGEGVFVASDDDPARARRLLVALGHREATPEYLDLIKREAEAWQAEAEARFPEEESRWLAPGAPAEDPDRANPRLHRQVLYDGVSPPLAVADVLARAAEQCDIAVMASFVPTSGAFGCRVNADILSARSLWDALQVLHRAVSGRVSWTFRGEMLVFRMANYRQVEQGSVSDDVLADWCTLLQPGAVVTIDDLARLAAELGAGEAWTLLTRLGIPTLGLPLDRLGLYGRLTESQKEQLASPEGLPLSRVERDMQVLVWYHSLPKRPWLKLSDLSRTVLRSVPRRFSTGQAAVTVVAEYNFPHAPEDRQVILTCLLRYVVPDRVPACDPDE
jgi:hypothetical protein